MAEELDREKILTLMAALTRELREVARESREYKDLDIDGALDSDIPDAAVDNHKLEGARSYRAASTLLEIRDKLGPMALAVTVAEIGAGQEGCFPKDIAEIVAKRYHRDYVPGLDGEAAAPATSPQEPTAAPAGQPQTEAKPRERSGKLGAIFTGAALMAASAGWAWQEKSAHNDALSKWRRASRHGIELRLKSPEELTPDQKRHLMELQEITIPELRDACQDTKPDWGPAIGILLGFILSTAGTLPEDKKKGSDNQEEIMSLPASQSTSSQANSAKQRAGKLMEALDEVLEEACGRQSPKLSLKEVRRPISRA